MSHKKDSPVVDKREGQMAEETGTDESGVESTANDADCDEVTFESSPSETALPDEESVDALKAQIESANDKYIRLMAEFDNYKRRTSREYDRMVELANESLMRDIIEVRENFERALNAGAAKNDYVSFYDGMKLIFNKLDENLQKNGLESFADAGDVFDPEIHDALMKAPNEEFGDDMVCEIFEKGYRLRGRVIKHARVVVSSGPAVEQAEQADRAAEQPE